MPAPATVKTMGRLRTFVVGGGLLISALELVLAAIAWVPHVRLHLAGWAVAPVVFVGPVAAVTIWATQRRGLDLGILRRLPRRLAIPGIAAMSLFVTSFGASLLRSRREPLSTCWPVYRASRYALDCHGSIRLTDGAHFFNIRALNLCWTSSVIGYFAVPSALLLRALYSSSVSSQPTVPDAAGGA